jgi:hypothetical protein
MGEEMLTVKSAAEDQLIYMKIVLSSVSGLTIEGISSSVDVLRSNDILQLIIRSFYDLDNFHTTQEILSNRSTPTT